MNLKGQAAIEYLVVFGLALLLSTPFIIRAQSSIAELRTGSEVIEIRNSLDKMESTVATVSAAGEPARRTFAVEIPAIVDSGRIENNSVIYSVRTRGGRTDIIRSFETNVTGSVPTSSGVHRITVYAKNGEVRIEVLD